MADFNRNRWPASTGIPGRHHRNTHRGCKNYYSRFYGSAMDSIWRHMNEYLMRWLMRKYKRLTGHKTRAYKALWTLAASFPMAFVHWEWRYKKAG